MTACEIVELERWGVVLGSRALGDEVRRSVANALRSATCVRVSFAGVDVVSSSFADEAIAQLLPELGLVDFKRRIRLTDANDRVKSVVTSALSKRRDMIACL